MTAISQSRQKLVTDERFDAGVTELRAHIDTGLAGLRAQMKTGFAESQAKTSRTLLTCASFVIAAFALIATIAGILVGVFLRFALPA